jgi:hypothetical protein
VAGTKVMFIYSCIGNVEGMEKMNEVALAKNILEKLNQR